MSANWYIVQVHSGFENKVAERIDEQAAAEGLDALIEEVLVPTEEVVSIRRGKKVTTERKYFPGYIMVKMHMNNASWHLVNDNPKVVGFPSSRGKTPIPMSEKEAQHILYQVKEGVENPRPAIDFEIGEQIRVSDGPFASFNGVVEEVDSVKSRLKVMVSIFSRATRVDLDYSQVEKL
ncbi:MAG: transcription termination/antitermination protein NusG [Alphaproteobacteria bacterium]